MKLSERPRMLTVDAVADFNKSEGHRFCRQQGETFTGVGEVPRRAAGGSEWATAID